MRDKLLGGMFSALTAAAKSSPTRDVLGLWSVYRMDGGGVTEHDRKYGTGIFEREQRVRTRTKKGSTGSMSQSIALYIDLLSSHVHQLCCKMHLASLAHGEWGVDDVHYK